MFKKLSRYKAFTEIDEGFRYLWTHLTAMHYFYVLYSLKDNRLYKGSTSNLLRRVEQHNAGATRSTKYRRPFILLYFEEYADQLAALSRERWSKSLEGGAALRELLTTKGLLNESGRLNISA